MSKHTPGPWEERTDAHGRGRISAGGVWIATTWLATGDGNDAPQLPARANARLIAAAPDLLEALKAIVKSLADQDDEGLIEHAQQMIDARAAIAKVKGGAA